MSSHNIIFRIRIVPIGSIDTALIVWLKQNLELHNNYRVFIEPPQDIPRGAYEKQRDQYLGDAILAFLRALRSHTGDTLLGIIDKDCYTDSLSYIFGQASLKGFEAFISLFRLRSEEYSLNSSVFNMRVITEAVHELGHTRGLVHCENPHCVMYFSRSITDTDNKGSRYCRKCKELLSRT
ncbi:MAG: archaemetzincin family Zn-dependent metalloprotease [Fibrobacter sp.]|nr:archaemetzincin family Zn-dependent metalloprotease [Fibrobacter sp.]